MFRQDNDLARYFNANRSRLIDRWEHYFEAFDLHLGRFRGQPVTVVEIGCYHGGSLEMWRQYFGERAILHCVDIDARCKKFESDNTYVHIGDQGDRRFLRELRARIGSVNVVIDDGGHRMHQQIASLEELYPSIVDGGLYACEDLHTSYFPEYGGGFKTAGTFIEFSKNLIDALHAFHSRSDELTPSDWTLSMHSLHFYDSLLIVEKRARAKPTPSVTGTADPELMDPPIGW